jgi:transposase-like protein
MGSTYRGGHYKKYSDKQKAAAILMVEAAGYPDTLGAIDRVSKEQKIPQRTLYRWVTQGVHSSDPEAAASMAETMEETRQELVELIENTVRKALKSMAEADVRDGATYRDFAWAAAVLIDKLQVLNGQPSQHIQQAITFERKGITTLPEHLTSITVEGAGGEA